MKCAKSLISISSHIYKKKEAGLSLLPKDGTDATMTPASGYLNGFQTKIKIPVIQIYICLGKETITPAFCWLLQETYQ